MGTENIGAGIIKCHLIFCIDSNIIYKRTNVLLKNNKRGEWIIELTRGMKVGEFDKHLKKAN